MMPICERCGKQFDPVHDYESWKYPETRNYQLCPECFQADMAFLTDAVLQGKKLAPQMGYGQLNPKRRIF